jgi:hypothetical protein
MSRLAPHPQPAPPRASAPRLRPALQRPPPASRAQPHAARPRVANPTTRQLGATRRRQPQRSPRRTDPRIQPGGMKPDLCTPQAANDRRRIARYRIEGLGKGLEGSKRRDSGILPHVLADPRPWRALHVQDHRSSRTLDLRTGTRPTRTVYRARGHHAESRFRLGQAVPVSPQKQRRAQSTCAPANSV